MRPGKSAPSAGKESVTMNIAIPNNLIFCNALTPSAKRVALAMLTFRWENKRLTKPLRFIAERAGVCRATARIALELLAQEGFLTAYRNYRYSEEQCRVVYSATTYTLRMDMKDGYTLLPYTTARRLLAAHISHATLLIYLVLACRQGQKTHAYPSLRNTAKTADLSKASICRGILMLVRVQLIAYNHCINRHGCYSCNCYYVIVNVIWTPIAQRSNHCDNLTIACCKLQAPAVVSFLVNPPVNNITKELYLEGKKEIGKCYVTSRGTHSISECSSFVPKERHDPAPQGRGLPFFGEARQRSAQPPPKLL